MVCKNCGAQVKDGQFSCSSCGTYLTKENVAQYSSLSKSNLNTGSIPVSISYGWKWYMFVTWGIIPLWLLNILNNFFVDCSISFIIGLVNIIYFIIGISAFNNLRAFINKAYNISNIFLSYPLVRFFVSLIVLQSKTKHTNINVSSFLFQPKTIAYILFWLIFLVCNMIYFKNRDDDFKY